MSAGSALPPGEAGVERQQALLQLAKRAGDGKLLSQKDREYGFKVATRLHFDVKQQEFRFSLERNSPRRLDTFINIQEAWTCWQPGA